MTTSQATAYFAGVDGGQSGTVAVIGDARGNVVGTGHGPAADLVGEARGSQRQAQAIETAVQAALTDARLPAGLMLQAVVCGVSGYEGTPDEPKPFVPCVHFTRVHDADIAQAGAFGGGPGILVISGTGSVALGIGASGMRARAGGWGFLFGDEGSAFWIGRNALSLAMRRADRGTPLVLESDLLAELGVPTLRGVQDAYARGELSRPSIARLAQTVHRAASGGDFEAIAIEELALDGLARLAKTVADRLGESSPKVSYAGGVLEAWAAAEDGSNERFAAAVAKLLPSATVAAPEYSPAEGALLLAYREAGVTVERLQRA